MTRPAIHPPGRDLTPVDTLVLLTCAEMGRADAAAIAGGIPGNVLMESAGSAVAASVGSHYLRRPVLVLCGPGNNGGDGFVAARHLEQMGWPVRLALLGETAALKGDAAWAAGLWRGPVLPMSPGLLDDKPLVIDALFGAGLSRAIDGVAAQVIERLNQLALQIVAVDVPSGLNGDTGHVMGVAPVAERSVTFFRAKPGHLMAEGLKRCGMLEVVDIGIPSSVLAGIGARLWNNAPALWATCLRRGAVDDHKYARGHLTILGGERATGAARLAALAARRSGAGLATIAAPLAALETYQMAEPGNLVAAADDAGGIVDLLKDERRNAFLIGPGSGLNARTRDSVLAVLAGCRGAVLDADALTVFAEDPKVLFTAIRSPVLMTPHEGEFRRLFPDLGEVASKVERVREAARRSGAVVLLKGPDTVVAAPDGRAVINVHAPPSLATAGSGDVLAGIAAGLMTQGAAPLAAGAAAAWLHGESAYRFRHPGLIAEDLLNGLPEALETAMN